MGLDMYLDATNCYYSSSWNKDSKNKEVEICNKRREILPEMYESGNLNYIRIRFEAGYWRKANQIHQWFVENVQDGQDDCGRYYVSREDLEKLLVKCKKVLESSQLIKGTVKNGKKLTKEGWENIYEDGEVIIDPHVAKQELPTTSGFFFGSTEYDKGYIYDLKNTIKIIENALKLPKGWAFEYHSSW
jgi:hypothetical protein